MERKKNSLRSMFHRSFPYRLKYFFHASLLFITLELSTTSANAATLDLGLLDWPVISSCYISSTYDATDDLFIANGKAIQYKVEPGAGIYGLDFWPINGNFDISAKIDEFGNATSGTLNITGNFPHMGYSGDLLTGDLIGFFTRETGGDPFQFIFEITGGVLEPEFKNNNSEEGIIVDNVGIILSTWNGDFTGSFESSFGGNSFSGVADVASTPVPLPGSFFLLISGLTSIFMIKRIRHLVKNSL